MDIGSGIGKQHVWFVKGVQVRENSFQISMQFIILVCNDLSRAHATV